MFSGTVKNIVSFIFEKTKLDITKCYLSYNFYKYKNDNVIDFYLNEEIIIPKSLSLLVPGDQNVVDVGQSIVNQFLDIISVVNYRFTERNKNVVESLTFNFIQYVYDFNTLVYNKEIIYLFMKTGNNELIGYINNLRYDSRNIYSQVVNKYKRMYNGSNISLNKIKNKLKDAYNAMEQEYIIKTISYNRFIELKTELFDFLLKIRFILKPETLLMLYDDEFDDIIKDKELIKEKNVILEKIKAHNIDIRDFIPNNKVYFELYGALRNHFMDVSDVISTNIRKAVFRGRIVYDSLLGHLKSVNAKYLGIILSRYFYKNGLHSLEIFYMFSGIIYSMKKLNPNKNFFMFLYLKDDVKIHMNTIYKRLFKYYNNLLSNNLIKKSVSIKEEIEYEPATEIGMPVENKYVEVEEDKKDNDQKLWSDLFNDDSEVNYNEKLNFD